ncbi:MAG: biopolymer transporter ExbD [Deltaproteobacteria bacterium]|nr:biopolymer transporter ExbD [Deltaproteobacteria bacterium]MBW2594577.1 biopolymer transporter ExbD [Deltaproteobacteria bacterium]
MKISRKHTDKARIEMIPLIDVVFLLLVTFIFFAMSMTINRGIPVNLPVSSAAQVKEKDCAEIAIKKNGEIFFNREKMNAQTLLSRLVLLHRELPGTKIIISGDREASYESVVSVIDTVKKAGISGLSLKTEIDNRESGAGSKNTLRDRK